MQDSPDDNGVAELDAGTLHAGKRNGEGLTQRALLVRDVVGNLVEPRGGVGVEAGEGAVVGGRREEDDAGAWG